LEGLEYHHQNFIQILQNLADSCETDDRKLDHKEVFALCPEPIIKQDGNQKNDCETNACHRLLADFKREHPHLKVIVTGDAIHSTGPHIRQLKQDNMWFILGVKPGSHNFLFEWVN
jgi:hypothetical protein